MDNPLPTFGMIVTYLAWVLVVGPTYMRDRKPLQLTRTLFYYNLFQVLLSAYMFYEVSYIPFVFVRLDVLGLRLRGVFVSAFDGRLGERLQFNMRTGRLLRRRAF